MDTSHSIDLSRIPDPMAQLDANEAALARRLGVAEAPYIPPAERFYHSNYILDGSKAARLRTAYGYFASAQKQLLSFRDTQRADGMVPGVSHPPDTGWKSRFTVNPERLLSTAPFESNDYTQTPVWGRSVLNLYNAAFQRAPISAAQAIDPNDFLRRVNPYLLRHYGYLNRERRVALDDPRNFLLHPHEANRDSGPEYDGWKEEETERQLGKLAVLLQRQARTGEFMPGLVNNYNIAVDYLGALAINLAGRKANWEPQAVRESTGEFIDVWFNVHLQENYRAMSAIAERLGRDEDQYHFQELATDLELALLNKHYFQDARDGKGGFYSTYNGRPVFHDTIGNLTPLLLPNLPPRHLKSILVMLDEGFNPKFPLPSVSMLEIAKYDPHYEEINRHWRGPKWIVADNMVMRGLDLQMDRRGIISEELRNRCWEWFYRIYHSNLAVVALNGFYAEHNNPITGVGQRVHKTKGHVFGMPWIPR